MDPRRAELAAYIKFAKLLSGWRHRQPRVRCPSATSLTVAFDSPAAAEGSGINQFIEESRDVLGACFAVIRNPGGGDMGVAEPFLHPGNAASALTVPVTRIAWAPISRSSRRMPPDQSETGCHRLLEILSTLLYRARREQLCKIESESFQACASERAAPESVRARWRRASCRPATRLMVAGAGALASPLSDRSRLTRFTGNCA